MEQKTKKVRSLDWIVLILTIFGFGLNLLGVGGVIIYYLSDNRFIFKYGKEYFKKTILWGLGIVALEIIIAIPIVFVLGFDDAGSIPMETKDKIMVALLLFTFILHIFFSIKTAKIYQKQKLLSYEEMDKIFENKFTKK